MGKGNDNHGEGAMDFFDRTMGMIRFTLPRGCEVRISIFAPVAAVLIMTADFSEYTALVLLAAVLHEAAHLIAMFIFGQGIERVSVYPFGADIKVSGMMGYREDFAVSSSGVAINFILFAVFCGASDTRLKFFAVCNLALAVVNLIPAKGLDGSRIIDSIIFSHFDTLLAERISGFAGALGLVGLAVFAVFVLIASGGNFSVAFILGYLILAVYGKERANDGL